MQQHKNKPRERHNSKEKSSVKITVKSLERTGMNGNEEPHDAKQKGCPMVGSQKYPWTPKCHILKAGK